MENTEKDNGALKRIMDENDAEVDAANAEVEKMADLKFEEFRAETIKQLKNINEDIGGTTGALYHAASQYSTNQSHMLDLLSDRFKDIDGAFEIALERVQKLEYFLWLTIIIQLRERGIYTKKKGRQFAKDLHIDFDKTFEALKDREAA